MHGPLTLHERIDYIGMVLAGVIARTAGVKNPQTHKLFDWPRIMADAATATGTPADGFAELWAMAQRNGEKVNEPA